VGGLSGRFRRRGEHTVNVRDVPGGGFHDTTIKLAGDRI
jgi:hypothetical protein